MDNDYYLRKILKEEDDKRNRKYFGELLWLLRDLNVYHGSIIKDVTDYLGRRENELSTESERLLQKIIYSTTKR